MEIDIYARYPAQSDDDLLDQDRYYTATEGRRFGYLRELYHDGPYVAEFLCR